MRLRIAVAGACLCVVPAANAMEPIQVLTAQITGLRPPVEAQPLGLGLELGPIFSVPLPTADVGSGEVGLSAGATATLTTGAGVGVGFDVVYHYWPTSDRFKADFSEWLRQQTLGTLELGGTTWRINALQTTAHLKLSAPSGTRVRPWLKLGAGIYNVNPNISGFRGDAGFFKVIIGPARKFSVLGGHAAAGIDLASDSVIRFGLDASYDYVSCKERLGSDFSALAIGAHVLFGLWGR